MTCRCVIDAAFNCGDDARRRRDVSSAVVDNVMQSAEPVNHFVEMMSEVFGDDSL